VLEGTYLKDEARSSPAHVCGSQKLANDPDGPDRLEKKREKEKFDWHARTNGREDTYLQ